LGGASVGKGCSRSCCEIGMSISRVERLRRIADPDVELFALVSLHKHTLAYGVDFHDTNKLAVHRLETHPVVVAKGRSDLVGYHIYQRLFELIPRPTKQAQVLVETEYIAAVLNTDQKSAAVRVHKPGYGFKAGLAQHLAGLFLHD